MAAPLLVQGCSSGGRGKKQVLQGRTDPHTGMHARTHTDTHTHTPGVRRKHRQGKSFPSSDDAE